MERTLYIFLVCWAFCISAFSQDAKFEQWKIERSEELLAEDGWLNLAGLLWLESGDNHLAAVSPDSLGIFQTPQRDEIGVFRVSDDKVTFIVSDEMPVEREGEVVDDAILFPIEHGVNGSLKAGKWKWAVIKRGDRFAVRLRNLEHPALERFAPTPTFAYDPNWSLEAFFQPKFNEFMSITNVLGQTIEWRVMGILKFKINGQSQELITLEDEGKLFVIFSDETNMESTYPSGRYLYVKFPDSKGNTTIDFNYAYNPPCAYTAYATCPIPPKENRLDFLIEAGEKVPEYH
jgi:uncharacterized protein (DUF1684 family)